MRVLLIQPPQKSAIPFGCTRDYTEIRSVLPPLGLLYLAGHLKHRHDVKVVDMGICTKSMEYTIDYFKPDLVGIPTLIETWPLVSDMFGEIKMIDPSIHTVAGGPNVTQYPGETLNCKNIDYAITGLGQVPLMKLCDALQAGGDGSGIRNCYMQGVPYTSYHTSYPHNLDDFSFPDRNATPYKKYNMKLCPENPTTIMVSSIGCPFRCSFCDSRNHHLDIRSAESVVNEMESIEKLGIRSIIFEDELFTLNPTRVRNICQWILDRNIKVNWLVKSRIDCIQPWMPELMKEAGCFGVHFGIESGNDSTLDRMNKGYHVVDIKNTVKMVKDAGLLCTGNFMLAYPGEDQKDIYNTIDFASQLPLDLSQFSITLDIPRTQLFSDAVQSGRRWGNPWSEFTKNPKRKGLVEMFSSNQFSHHELLKFLDDAHTSTRTLYNA